MKYITSLCMLAILFTLASTLTGCGCSDETNTNDKKLRDEVKNNGKLDMSKVPEKDRAIVEAMLNQGKNRQAAPPVTAEGGGAAKGAEKTR
ncbi:MAG: hypothetical protein ACOYON_06180 [Fimbriimonas sp.]